MRYLHTPLWLTSLRGPSVPAFVTLFGLEPLNRATLVTVIPLMALDHFGDAQKVSVFYFVLSLVGALSSLGLPWLVSALTRRGTFSMGVASVTIALVMFSLNTPLGLIAGMVFHLFGAACFEVSMSLYMLEHIRRQEVSKFEPVRVFFMAAAWTIGPFLGVYLRNAYGVSAPFIFCALSVTALASYFYYLRLSDNPALKTARRPVTNPMHYLPRFFAQPRLRLAWILALGRSGWWMMFFIYAPIYCVTNGLGEEVGGALVSIGTAFVLLVPLARPVISRIGTRAVLMIGYIGCGLITAAVLPFSDAPWITVFILGGAAMAMMPVDSVGNMAFYRAVHPYERAEMTTMFGTYRAVSQLAFPGVFALVLKILPLSAVFVTAGAGMVTLGALSRYIPRKMK